MSNTPSTDTDPWDRPLDDGGKVVSARHKGAELVPDAWDDDATSSGEEDSQRIWDNANKEAPMPQLVMTSPRTGSLSSVVPPASAFQPPIRILKRSAAPTHKGASDGDGSPASGAIAGTFAERSARYNAARERIFAARTTAEASSSVGTGEGGGGGGAVSASAIIRNPKGPEPARGPNGQGTGEGSQGFGTRTGKRASPNEKQGPR